MSQLVQVQIRLSPKRLSFKVPISWEVNKIKCLIVTKISTLKFQNFKLIYEGVALNGWYPIRLYIPLGDQKIVLSIRKSQNCESFSSYYENKMTKFFKKLQQEEESIFGKFHTLNNYSLPFLNHNYQKAFISNQFQNKEDNLNNQLNPPDQAAGGFGIFTILQILGLYFTFNIIYNHGSSYQILIIVSICILYYLIDKHVKNQEGRRRQRNNARPNNPIQHQQPNRRQLNRQQPKRQQPNRQQTNSQQPNSQQPNRQQPQNVITKRIQGKILCFICATFEFIYCYFLSLFPNWTYETHLEANRQVIIKMINKIEQLDDTKKGKIKID